MQFQKKGYNSSSIHEASISLEKVVLTLMVVGVGLHALLRIISVQNYLYSRKVKNVFY